MPATIPINTKSNTTTTTPAMQMEIIPHTRPAFTFLNEDSVYSSGDCKYSFRCPPAKTTAMIPKIKPKNP